MLRLLNDHLSPKPLVIAEHFRFHKRDQKEGESITVYVAELRKLTEHCKFGGTLNDALRDRLICGIKNENIQKKLLSVSNLTLQKATEISSAMETAAKNAIELQHQHRPDPVHKVSKKKDSSSKTLKLEKRACFCCDRKNHPPRNASLKTKDVDFVQRQDTSNTLV